jgi:hypothetical protein
MPKIAIFLYPRSLFHFLFRIKPVFSTVKIAIPLTICNVCKMKLVLFAYFIVCTHFVIIAFVVILLTRRRRSLRRTALQSFVIHYGERGSSLQKLSLIL